MGLFKSAEEKEAARKKRAAEHNRREEAIRSRLDAARGAARAGSMEEEERAIHRAERASENIQNALSPLDPDRLTGLWSSRFLELLGKAVAEKQLRIDQEYLGFAGHVHIWTDRVLVYSDPPVFHALDGNVRASVETAGQLMQSSRPTLTRMAVGAVLPGSALIPGFALQKKEITDSRELFFVLEHPDWLETVRSRPSTRAK